MYVLKSPSPIPGLITTDNLYGPSIRPSSLIANFALLCSSVNGLSICFSREDQRDIYNGTGTGIALKLILMLTLTLLYIRT